MSCDGEPSPPAKWFKQNMLSFGPTLVKKSTLTTVYCRTEFMIELIVHKLTSLNDNDFLNPHIE